MLVIDLELTSMRVGVLRMIMVEEGLVSSRTTKTVPVRLPIDQPVAVEES